MHDDMTTDWGDFCDAWKINTQGPARRSCGMPAVHDIGGVIYLCRFHYKNAYNDLWFKVMTQEDNLPFTLPDDVHDSQLGALRKAMGRQYREIEDLEDKNSELEAQVEKLKEKKLAKTYKPKASPGREQQVYFIRCEEYVKIGISSDPENRLKNIQRSGNGTLAPKLIDLTTAEIVATTSGGHYTESKLHQQFAEDRHVGEWFRESPELTAYIDGLLLDLIA